MTAKIHGELSVQSQPAFSLFLVSTNSCCALCLALGGGCFYTYHC